MDRSAIERELTTALPADLQRHAPQLAEIIVGVLDRSLSAEQASRQISEPALAPALRALAGQSIQVGAESIQVTPATIQGDVETLQPINVSSGGVVAGDIVGSQFVIRLGPTPQAPRYGELQALVGFVIDLSGAMQRTILAADDEEVDRTIGRLEEFRRALDTIARDALLAVKASHQHGGDPQIKVLAYGYGLRNLERSVYNLMALIEAGEGIFLKGAPQRLAQARGMPIPSSWQGDPSVSLLGNLFQIAERLLPGIAEVFGELTHLLLTSRSSLEQRLRQLDKAVYSLDRLVPLWENSGLVLGSAGHYRGPAPLRRKACRRRVLALRAPRLRPDARVDSAATPNRRPGVRRRYRRLSRDSSVRSRQDAAADVWL